MNTVDRTEFERDGAAEQLAALHGLLQLDAAGQLQHCPVMLTPAPLRADTFAELEALTPLYSTLAHRVASSGAFLIDALSGVAESDAYIEFLLGLARERHDAAPARLSITRSDYFTSADGRLLRQVELNTIAASYLGLGGRVADFHNAWATRTGASWRARLNAPTVGVADAFEAALAAYGVPSGRVLFVVLPGERNIVDQRLLELELAARGINVLRRTFDELGEQARLHGGELFLGDERIAVTYLRAGLLAADLASESARRGWRTIARSSTIAAPDIPLMLAGTKKVQQLLTDRRVLSRFLPPEDATRVARSFALLAAPDDPITIDGREQLALDAALERPDRFVLKPQREGGGNNLYDHELTRALRSMSRAERSAYILMERLEPPARPAVGLRAGAMWRGEVVSEFGHYGALLTRGERIVLNRGVGYLVRTKAVDAREGGICSGAGHLDSVEA